MTAPRWLDAPDQAGLWIGRYPDGVGGFCRFTDDDIANYTHEPSDYRYFGPLPPDPLSGKEGA